MTRNRIVAFIFVLTLCLTPGLTLAQNLTPSDTVSVQMNSNNAGQNNGHLQVQYAVNGQNLNTSTESLIRFDLTALLKSTPVVTSTDIQSANLILFVNSGGGPAGIVTVCELAAGPVWSSSTITGTSIPGCSSQTATFSVTSSQLKNGAFISVPITMIVQSWLSAGVTNNGIELEADAPPTGSQPLNVQFDALASNGQGFAPMIQVVTNTGVTTISTAPGLLVNGGAGPAIGADTLTVDTSLIATNSSVSTAVAGGVSQAEGAAAAALANFASNLAGAFLSLSGGTVSGSITAQTLNSSTTLQILSQDVLKADSSNNSAMGFGALTGGTTGTDNTATGAGSLKATKSGSRNTAHGSKSLSSNTSGSDNTAHGWNVLTNVTTGNANSAVGSGAMSSEASGNNNVAHGKEAMKSHTSGDDNTAIGTQAGMNLQTGTQNVMLGKKSGQYLASTESWNIMINNDGVAGDNNTIRLGKDVPDPTDPTDTNDQQTKTYIAGIYEKKQSQNTNAKHVLIDTTTGQLGIDETSGQTSVNSVSASTGLMNTGSASAPTLAVDPTVVATVNKEQTDVGNAITAAQGFANAAAAASLPLSGGTVTGAVTVAAPVTVTSPVEAQKLNSDTTLQIQSQDVLKSDANNNVAVGIGSLKTGASAGKENTGAGYQSLSNLTSGSQNTACGKGALMSETSGTGNTAHGWDTLMNQNGGSNNTAIGAGAGKAYTGTESNNILVGNAGVQGESNTIRIGTDTGSTSQKTYIAGVWNRVTNDATTTQQVVIDQSGNLGTVPLPTSTSMLLNEMQKLSRDNAADQAEIAKLRSQVAEQLKQGREQQAAIKELMAQVHGIQATVAISQSGRPRARVASAATKKTRKKTAKPEVKHPSGQVIASLTVPVMR